MLGTSMAQAVVNLGLGSFGVDTVATAQVIGEYFPTSRDPFRAPDSKQRTW